MEKDYEIDIEEERMRNKFVEFLVVLLGGAVMLAVAVFSLPAVLGEGQERPKLDCQKMALDYAQALESLDVRTLFLLKGVPYSREAEAAAKKELGSPEARKLLAPIIGMIRLFPKINAFPDWVTEVNVEYKYIEGNELIEMQGDFVLSGDRWLIQELEPRESETLDEAKRAEYARELSPAPPEGQKTLEARFDFLVAVLNSAVQQKSWNAVKATGALPGDCGLHSSDPPAKREKILKMLSQFPSIGAIPAPAKSFRLALKGTLDGQDSLAEIGFHWPGNQLRIEFVQFK